MFSIDAALLEGDVISVPQQSNRREHSYDTTIVFGAGIVSTQLKFPKFDPDSGIVPV